MTLPNRHSQLQKNRQEIFHFVHLWWLSNFSLNAKKLISIINL